eukprot:gene40836-43713_t
MRPVARLSTNSLSAGSPGGVFRDVYFVENTAAGNGGAIKNNQGALDFEDCVFSGNIASSWKDSNAEDWVHGGNSTSDQHGAITLASLPQRHFHNLAFCQNKGTPKSGTESGSSAVGLSPCVSGCDYPGAPVCVYDTVTFAGDTWDGWSDLKTIGGYPGDGVCTVTNTEWPGLNHGGSCSLVCDGANPRCAPVRDDPSCCAGSAAASCGAPAPTPTA